MSLLTFELLATEDQARAGVFHTAHGPLATPIYAPVGTQATVKAVTHIVVATIATTTVATLANPCTIQPGKMLPDVSRSQPAASGRTPAVGQSQRPRAGFNRQDPQVRQGEDHSLDPFAAHNRIRRPQPPADQAPEEQLLAQAGADHPVDHRRQAHQRQGPATKLLVARACYALWLK